MIPGSSARISDLERSFNRPDRPFFASGACHVLAQAFLDSVQTDDWFACLILPDPGFRGMHVFATNQQCVFDYHGFTPGDRFQSHYFSKMNRRFPGWAAQILALDVSPISQAFCERYNHRMPQQFFQNPMPRAIAYVQKFQLPD